MKWGLIKYSLIAFALYVAYELVVWRNLALDHVLSEYDAEYSVGDLKVVELINQVSLYDKFSSEIWYKYDGRGSYNFLSGGDGSNVKRTAIKIEPYRHYDIVFVGDFTQSLVDEREKYSYPAIYFLEPNDENLMTRLELRHDPYVDFYRRDEARHFVHCSFSMGTYHYFGPDGKKWHKRKSEDWLNYFSAKKKEADFMDAVFFVFDKLNLDRSCLEGM